MQPLIVILMRTGACSGHSVAGSQPLAGLEILERAISGKDIATGSVDVCEDYITHGSAVSTYREGNATIQKK